MDKKSRMVMHLPWIALYVAFVFSAVLLRRWVQGNGLYEVWGWDYQTFVGQISDWRWIGYFGFRHPCLGLVCSPLVVLQHLWMQAYLVVMPVVALLTAWLIWRMSGLLGLAVWLMFPTTWLMAGIPESFPIAQLALVGSAYWLLNGAAVARRWGVLAFPLGVLAFAAVNTAVTLTNGVKPVVAYMVTHLRMADRRRLICISTGLALAVAVGVAFFYLRTLVTGRGVSRGIAATLAWIPDERNFIEELHGFFIRPVGVWQSLLVYPLAVWGICKSVRIGAGSTVVLFFSYFAVDLIIHVVIGWGMSEPWVFAPHWIWVLPILIGLPYRTRLIQGRLAI